MPAKAHILIIDDDANTLASLARAFRLAGHEASVCDNAARAIELAKAERFDLILSDVVMPGGLTGYDLVREARRLRPELKVLLTSGYTSPGIGTDEMEIKGLELISKPFRLVDLAILVRSILAEK